MYQIHGNILLKSSTNFNCFFPNESFSFSHEKIHHLLVLNNQYFKGEIHYSLSKSG